MPDLDGFSILETMQTDSSMKNIPVIILTGADLNEIEKQKIDKYKSDLIKKDMFQEDELAKCLGRALAHLEESG
jgi:CheY-like chemotaxis protein